MKARLTIPFAAAILLLAVATAAFAEQREIVTVGREDADFGEICTVETDNNESVHPGNMLRLWTGNTEIIQEGVEDEPFLIFTFEIEAEGEIVADVVIGEPGGRTSLEVVFDCRFPETTTTTTPEETTTTSTPVTEPTTTTTPVTHPTTSSTLPVTGPSPVTAPAAAFGLWFIAAGALILAWVKPFGWFRR